MESRVLRRRGFPFHLPLPIVFIGKRSQDLPCLCSRKTYALLIPGNFCRFYRILKDAAIRCLEKSYSLNFTWAESPRKTFALLAPKPACFVNLENGISLTHPHTSEQRRKVNRNFLPPTTILRPTIRRCLCWGGKVLRLNPARSAERLFNIIFCVVVVVVCFHAAELWLTVRSLRTCIYYQFSSKFHASNPLKN